MPILLPLLSEMGKLLCKKVLIPSGRPIRIIGEKMKFVKDHLVPVKTILCMIFGMTFTLVIHMVQSTVVIAASWRSKIQKRTTKKF